MRGVLDSPAITMAESAFVKSAPHSGNQYDPVTIFLHWVTAFLVVLLFASPYIWRMYERRTPPRLFIIDLHFSVGITLAAIVMFRILWRMFGAHAPTSGSGLVHLASRVMHFALYVLLCGQFVLGFLLRWAQQQPLTYFWLFNIPDPIFVPHDSRMLLGTMHEWNAWAIIVLSGIHALAALLHHYALRDAVLFRMVPIRTFAGAKKSG